MAKTKARYYVEVIKANKTTWWWRIKKAANGRILATSKTYTRKESCWNAAWNLWRDLLAAGFRDLTLSK